MDTVEPDGNSVIQSSARTQKFKALARLKFILGFSTLVALIGIGWYLALELVSVQARLSEIETRLTLTAETNRSFSVITSRLDNKTLEHAENFDEMFVELARLSSMVDLNADRLAQLGVFSSHHQLLMEASNLFSIAKQQSYIGGEPDETLSILKSLDKIFAELANDRFMSTRQALERDMEALSRREKFDMQKIYSQLASLSEDIARLESLPQQNLISNDEYVSDEATSELTAYGQTSGVRQVWNRIVQKFSDLVIISRRDSTLEPLLSREQLIASRQTLVLLIRHAQTALLFGDPDIFSSSLIDAVNYLDRQFKTSQEASEIVSVLRHLSEMNVARETINIEDSLTAVERAIKWLGQQPEKEELTE